MADYFRKGKSLFSTTCNTFSSGTSVTITPNSVTGLPTDCEICLTFDRVDSSGTATPTKMERIIGTISGANFAVRTSPSSGRGADGTSDAAHTSPVVEYIPNAKDMNDQIDGILVAHAQTGIHKSGATYAAPVFSGSATGTYTLAGTPTITSPAISSPVLSGAGATAAGTLGYGATDHNLLVGDGTTNNPVHIGHWKAFTPAWTNLTEGSATNTGYYCLIGKTVHFWANILFAADTSISGSVLLALPVSAVRSGLGPMGQVIYYDAGTETYMGHINLGGELLFNVTLNGDANSKIVRTVVSATAPFTWTTGDYIEVTGTYEAA